jgi:hypothetical protein
MNALTVISTVFGLVMTAFGIGLTIRANHNAKSAPFEERQAALRGNCEHGSTRSSV